MDQPVDNFDVIFEKMAEITEDDYAVTGRSVEADLDDIAELRRFASALNDERGFSYTTS
jgi:hypothetical protein